MDKKLLSRFLKRKASVLGGIIIIIFVFIAIVGPFLCTQDPLKIDVRNKYENISKEHWLGTDNL